MHSFLGVFVTNTTNLFVTDGYYFFYYFVNLFYLNEFYE